MTPVATTATEVAAAVRDPGTAPDAGTAPAGTAPVPADPAVRSRIAGLRCKNCHRPEAIGPYFVCPA